MRSRTVCSETSSHIAKSKAVRSRAKNRRQAFGLPQRPGKTVKYESVAAMQAQPVFD